MGEERLKRGIVLLAAAAAVVLPALPGSVAQAAGPDTRDLAAKVHPLAGSLGPGFPMVGASRPFGMIQAGPNTGQPGHEDPVNYTGYSYIDSKIRGFALTHFDGAGIHIAGDLPFMPTTGAVSSTDANSFASTFSHVGETAQPGYYAVNLATYNTGVELSATERAAIMRIRFPAAAQGNVLVDASRSIPGMHPASVTVVGDRTVQGSMRSEDAPHGYVLYFVAVFDRPFSSFGTWAGGTVTPASRSTSGSANGAILKFDPSGQDLNMRVGISYVDAAAARGNLDAEIPAGASLESVRAAAHDAWNNRLHDIEVSGGAGDQQATFYTNLYRALSMPSIFDDIDGRYRGFDGAVHSVRPGQHHYTNLSLWDTYRTQTPLLELIEPQVAHDVQVSLLDDYDQNRQAIPRWTQANLDYGIMGGDSGSATVADGVMRGLLRGDEARRALAALWHQATALPSVFAREHLDAYLARGYIGQDVSGIGAAQTQEYAIDDHAVLGIAQAFGTAEQAAALRHRADSWRNLLDPSGYIQPRNSDGSWANPTRLGPVTLPWSPDFQDGYQEGTGWQYLWLEPQDVAGLTAAIGGPAVTRQRLDRFFSRALTDAPYAVPVAQQYTSLFGIYYIGNQYTPANEPDLQSPYFYNWLGQPWKTSQVVRAAMGTYSPRPDGLPGNDDTGTMAAWYVLASVGLYGVTPGVPVYEVNSPAYESVTLHLGDASSAFTISAPGASSLNKYVQAAGLDGAVFNRTYLTQCDIHPGGHLDYVLGPGAGSSWAAGVGAAPPSVSDAVVAPPLTACEQRLGVAPRTAAAAHLPDTSTATRQGGAGPETALLLLAGLGLAGWARYIARRRRST